MSEAAAGEAPAAEAALPTERTRDRRRFIWSLLAAVGVVLPFRLWVGFDDWTGSFDLHRSISAFSAFYDDQAESIKNGHLWVKNGSLGLEGFVHNGHTYTYFGLLPSLLRIPFLVVSVRFYGHLTAMSMLVSWIVTIVAVAVLWWRVRRLLRGNPRFGRAEWIATFLMMITILGGSVLMFLASEPWVYNEANAWSIPVTLFTLYFFLGVLERASLRNVSLAGAFVLLGVLGRPPAALWCILGAAFLAIWLLVGKQGAQAKRLALPMAAGSGIPFLLYCALNELKFGTLLNGLPLAHQVWTTENAHRRVFLASTHGSGYNVHLWLTDVWAYFQPFGLRAQPTFPYLTFPEWPPHVFGGYTIDILYPTASVPSSMPLLFLLSALAVVVCFRPKAGVARARFRMPLLVAFGGTSVDYFLGYIAPRYLGDFFPFLVRGASIGFAVLFDRMSRAGRKALGWLLGVVAVLCAFSLFVNVALAVSPQPEWTPQQATNYLSTVKALSDVTGHPLRNQVLRGTVLPSWAPANEVFVGASCQTLFLSSGIAYGIVPVLQAQHHTWIVTKVSGHVTTAADFQFDVAPRQWTSPVTMATIGSDTLWAVPKGKGVQYRLDSPLKGAQYSDWFVPKLHRNYVVIIQANDQAKLVSVEIGGQRQPSSLFTAPAAGHVTTVLASPAPQAAGALAPLRYTRLHHVPEGMALCRSINADR